MRWLYLHSVCGKPAFAATKKPVKGEVMQSKYAQHLDGQQIQFQEQMVCDSCGRPVFGGFFSLERVVLEEGGES